MDYRAYRDALRQRYPEPRLAFEPAEYEARLSRVRQAMAEDQLDVLLLTDPGELCYLTGYATFEVSVQCVLLLSAERSVLLVPAIEVGPAVYLSRVDEAIGYPWQSPEAIARTLAAEIRKMTEGARPRIGFDSWSGSLRPGLLAALRGVLDEARMVDGRSPVDRIRVVKSPAELSRLAKSASITRLGLDAAAHVIRPGVVDHQIAQAGANAMLGAGSEFMSMQPIVAAGARSGIIHTSHAGHVVEAGDVVFCEFGAVRHRYTAPLMRTMVIGEAPAEVYEFHRVCLDVLNAVMAAARAGRTFADAATAGQAALAPLAERAFFSGVFGYPVGAAFPPSWVAGSAFITADNRMLFAEDMVFHLPICLRKPGEFGVGFSETVRITATGAEAITDNDMALHQVPPG